MTQAKVRFPTFEAYLDYSNETALEGKYALISGDLVELPPESELNIWIATKLQFLLAAAQIAPLRLIKIHSLELQVPILQPKDPANRYPDLTILQSEHITLTQTRLTLTLDMPPPHLIAEVVSPGQANYNRDYRRKRSQYAHRGIPEYWIINPQAQSILVLQLGDQDYQEIGIFKGSEQIQSSLYSTLRLTPNQIFQDQR